jgi:hypothetical protein
MEKVYGCVCISVGGVTLFFVIFEGGRVSCVLMAGIVWSWYKL